MAQNVTTTKRSRILIEHFLWLQTMRAHITFEAWPGI